MSIRIERLKLRLPAGTTRRPEAFAADLARHLARSSTTGEASRAAELVTLRVARGRDRGDALHARVASAVHAALRDKGRR